MDSGMDDDQTRNPPAPGPVSPVIGPAFMLLTAFLSASLSGGIRMATADIHPFEVAFLRNLFGFIVLAPFLLRQGLTPFRTRRLGLHVLRSALNVGSMLLFFSAVAVTPLAKVTSLTFLSPVFATLFAVSILHERVGAARWTAVGLGLLGALIIVRPGVEAIDPGTAMTVCAAMFWAVVLIIVKTLSRTDSPVTITYYSVTFLTLFSAVPAALVWTWPQGVQWGWLVFIGIAGTSAHLSLAQAFKFADASALLPLDFTKLIWVAAIGFLFFAEIPTIWTWIGGAVILGSTTFIAHRESRAARRKSKMMTTR